MPKCRWIVVFALGLTLVSSGQAQEETQRGQGRPAEQQQPASNAPPLIRVDIVEDHAAAEARQRREAEAAQREKDDLVAQQGMNLATQAMNDATQRMADFAHLQTWLIGIGTALLFGTLYLTHEANKAAQAAVGETRRIGEAQVRAYVAWGGARTSIGTGKDGAVIGFEFGPSVRNSGQSPAHVVAMYSYGAYCDPDVRPIVRFDLNEAATDHFIGAQNGFEFKAIRISLAEAVAVFEKRKRFYVLGWGAYRHIFMKPSDPPSVVRFCFELEFKIPPANATRDGDFANLTSITDYVIEPNATERVVDEAGKRGDDTRDG